MEINDILKLPILKNATVRTGTIGLQNKVESAMILEASDIEKWGKENQIILTSFFALENLSKEELAKFFFRAYHVGISAIILKINRLITDTPKYMLELCLQYKIPLIEISKDISYESIQLGIFEPLFSYQSHLLRTYYDSSKRFAEIKEENLSYEEIFKLFHELIGEDCQLRINDENITIINGQAFSRDYNIISKVQFFSVYSKNNYYRYKLMDKSNHKILYKFQIFHRLRSDWNFSIEIIKEDINFDDSLIMVVETAIDLIIQKIHLEKNLQNKKYRLYNGIAASILFNTYSSLEDLDSLLEETEMDQGDYYQSIGILKETEEDDLHHIKKILSHQFDHSIYYENRKYIILLLNFTDKIQALNRKKVIQSKIKTGKIVISSVQEKNDISKTFKECMELIKMARNYKLDRIIQMEDLGIIRYYLSSKDLVESDPYFIELSKLYQEHPDLFNTFISFILNNQSYQIVAEEIYVHPKTVRYRIKKIQGILHFSISNPMQYLNMSLLALTVKYFYGD